MVGVVCCLLFWCASFVVRSLWLVVRRVMFVVAVIT